MNKDADVVSAPRDGQTLSYRNIVYGTVLVLLGIGGLIVGVSSGLIVVGVIAFVVMVAGVVLAVTPAKNAPLARAGGSTSNTGSGTGGGTKKPSGSSSSFMDRMNDRWDRRQDGH